jgi:hypothetical protein
MHWASSLLREIYKPSSVTESQIARLWLDGMNRMWFAVGALDFEDGDLPATYYIEDVELKATFSLQLFEKYINWIPRLSPLSERFAEEGISGAWQRQQFTDFWWCNGAIRLAARASVLQGSDDWPEGCVKNFNGDVIQWLASKGVIEKTDQGYKALKPPV